jgi:hypothetical protein
LQRSFRLPKELRAAGFSDVKIEHVLHIPFSAAFSFLFRIRTYGTKCFAQQNILSSDRQMESAEMDHEDADVEMLDLNA